MKIAQSGADIDVDPSDLDIPTSNLNQADSNTLANVLSIVFVVAAGVALVVLILAGIRFMTSRGDPQKVAQARNTIIYATIGLVLMALAFSIVQFVAGAFTGD